MSLTRTDVTDQTVLPPATEAEIAAIDAWWRANNYLTIGQIYLQDNPLLRRAADRRDIKPRLLGHWGTSPGLSFIYAHVSRLIRHTGQQAIYLPAPATAARRWSPPATWKAPTARSTRRSPRTRRACSGCSGSSPPRAASPATSR